MGKLIAALTMGKRKFVCLAFAVAIALAVAFMLMPRRTPNLTLLLVVVILAVGIGFGFLAGRKISSARASRGVMDIRSTVKAILPISEFSSLVYHYSAVITHSDAGKLFGSNIPNPFKSKKAICTIDGTIKLGFDVRKIAIVNKYNNIIVRMPGIQVLSHELYPETLNLYDEKTSLFGKYTIQDSSNLLAAHKAEQLEKVSGDLGLFTQAEQSAELVFRPLLENIPEVKRKGYKVVFKWEGVDGKTATIGPPAP